jgi:hypothetical protein
VLFPNQYHVIIFFLCENSFISADAGEKNTIMLTRKEIQLILMAQQILLHNF